MSVHSLSGTAGYRKKTKIGAEVAMDGRSRRSLLLASSYDHSGAFGPQTSVVVFAHVRSRWKYRLHHRKARPRRLMFDRWGQQSHLHYPKDPVEGRLPMSSRSPDEHEGLVAMAYLHSQPRGV